VEELMKKAQEFMAGNPSINEIELSDVWGNKVRLVRNSIIIYQNPIQWYQPPYSNL